MAATAASSPSPAPSNNSSDAAVSTTAAAPAMLRMETPSKTLRGLNKPKCIQCGNVARSSAHTSVARVVASRPRTPATSTVCSSFRLAVCYYFLLILMLWLYLFLVWECVVAVLKLPPAPIEKPPPPSTPVAEQQPAEPPPPAVSHRPSPRQPLQSNAYKLLYAATRSRKPLTRKEAAAINEWRFSKLREYNERNIEMENDAFDRYMKNANLLEEVFSTTSDLEIPAEEGLASSSTTGTSIENVTKMVSRQKWRLGSNPLRSENVRNKIKQVVDDGLMKLKNYEYVDNVNDEDDENEGDGNRKWAKTVEAERHLLVHELIDKLNTARNEDDLKSCLEMKAQTTSMYISKVWIFGLRNY